MSSVLDAILARTRERVATERSRLSLGPSHPAVREAPPVRPFATALGNGHRHRDRTRDHSRVGPLLRSSEGGPSYEFLRPEGPPTAGPVV